MTNEEANKEAVERIERNICNHMDLCRWVDCEKCAVGLAIKALKKADKYRWHDLSENPDDLPEANGWGESNYVLVKALIKVECFACNDMRKAYYSHTQKKWSIDGHVFAWRYIEPFKEEE